MSMSTEDRQINFLDGADLELLASKIISYSKFLIETDAYKISYASETIEAPDSINIEKNHADDNQVCSQPPKDVVTGDTKAYYIRLSDFLSEYEQLLGLEAVAF